MPWKRKKGGRREKTGIREITPLFMEDAPAAFVREIEKRVLLYGQKPFPYEYSRKTSSLKNIGFRRSISPFPKNLLPVGKLG